MNAQLSNGHLYASLILVTVDPREVYSANAGIWKSKDFFKTSLRENTRPAGTAGTPRATRRSSIISIMKKLPYAICIHMLCLILDGLPQELTYFHPFIRWFKHITHKPKQRWLKWKVSVIFTYFSKQLMSQASEMSNVQQNLPLQFPKCAIYHPLFKVIRVSMSLRFHRSVDSFHRNFVIFIFVQFFKFILSSCNKCAIT